MAAAQAVWKRTGLIHRRIDYATVVVVCGWVGLFILWPEMPQTDSNRVPLIRGALIANGTSLPVSEAYRRPDLIAFPSELSFAAKGVEEALPDGVDLMRQEGASVLPRERATATGVDEASGEVALAAEAVREVSRASAPSLYAPWDHAGPEPLSSIAVEVSRGLGKSVPRWSEADQRELFGVDRVWEVEISLTMTDDGRPVDVFLETSSGDAKIDRAVMMAVVRPGLWQNASPGRGTVLISFSP